MTRALVSAICVVLLAAAQAAAQQRAMLTGRVTDRSTGRGIASAELILLSDSRSVSADSIGKYVFRGLAPGVSQILVRAPNFPTLQFIVDLSPGQEFERPVVLDSTSASRAQTLPIVGVTAPAVVPNYRLTGFERRKLSGRGQYLTEEDIVKAGAFNVADAVKHLRGVTYECGGGQGCFVRMTRAPARCKPEYVVDDVVMNDFGPATPIRDIVAIELYNGPADVAAEFAGRNAGCGVIVIHTRSGPARRRP